MLATYGEKFIQVTTICVLLPYTIRCLAQNHTYIPLSEKRSLNNYIATSVPYTVENQSSHQNELTNEKVDTALITPEGSSQDVLDCLNENHCLNNITSSEPSSSEGTFRPYSQDELNKILQKYQGDKENIEAQETSNKVANYYSIASSNNIESSSPTTTDPHDKSKAWNTVSYTQNYNNKNPYDDRMGWVTLEPIAWSSSQVQKWEPNQKPMWPIPPQNNGPWGSSSQYQQQSSYGGYSERPYKKPTYQYQNNKPWNANQHYQKPQFGDNFGNQEIITDGQPGYFPAERPSSTGAYKPWVEQTQSISYIDSSNRPSTHVVYQGIGTGAHPHHIPERPSSVVSSSSSDGDGHWVLLSSTKGYSVPHNRQRSSGRSLESDDKVNTVDAKDDKAEKSYRPLSARRSVRLTVLPSLNGAGSTVTSHNGMIEVDASRQTVDEAHREHLARMMRFGNSTDNQVSPSGSSFRAVPGKVEAVARPANRRNTLLTAVSAGMIPATMAMLLPMLFGRRKRSVIEPQIVTLDLRKFNKPGIITKYQKKPIKEISKKKLISAVEFY